MRIEHAFDSNVSSLLEIINLINYIQLDRPFPLFRFFNIGFYT